jgi:DNA-binding NarL/FixJ family response regulator
MSFTITPGHMVFGTRLAPIELMSQERWRIMLQSMDRVGDAEQIGTLTRRERQVAALVCRGLSNKNIAHKLGVSEGTVKSHVHRIFQKLRLPNRCALIIALSSSEAP